MLKRIVPLVLLASFTQVRAQEKIDIAPCFDFPSDRSVSVEGRRKATAYLQSLSADKEAARAIEIVCPQTLLRRAMATKKALKAIKVDGKDDDWAGVPLAVADVRGNVEVFDKAKPAAPSSLRMDLSEVSYVCTDQDLYLRFKTHDTPQLRDTTYWLQVYVEGKAACSVIVSQKDVYVQDFRRSKVGETINVPKGKFEVAIKSVVEARLSRSVLPPLPPVFRAIGLSYSDIQNRVNYTTEFTLKPAQCLAATTQAYLLAHYAEKTDLARAGLVPLALSLTESVILENADARLRDRVIEDGLAMIAASRDVPDQLADIPFETVVAWSNRMMTWGGLMGPYLDKRGLITAEAYDFMCLDPRILKDVRQHLPEAGIGKQRTRPELAEAIDKWANDKNRYRWKLEVLEEWARTQTPREYWARIYKEAREDVKAGRDKICTVNGDQIDFTSVSSPNLNWSLYKKNGYYYGCCGDVAIMSMLAYKALGIPDTCFVWHFGKEDADVHTFAGYYDRSTKMWRSPESPPESMKVNAGPVLLWSLPGITDAWPSYVKRDFGGGMELYISSRNPFLKMSLKEMRRKLTDGFAPAEFATLVYAQVEAGK